MNKLKKGWKSDILGNVAELQRGFDLPSAKRIDGNIPIISSGGISGYHNEPKVSAPGVITGRYGTIGSVFYVEEDFWPLNTSLWVKNFFGNNPKFVYYLLSNIDFKKFSDKTGVPGVNRNELHSIKVNIPPLNEQIQIAETLSTWDNAIQATEKLLENSQQQKKALMQRLLDNKKRKDWKKVIVSDICNIGRGRVISKKEIEENQGIYPVYSSQTLNNGVMGYLNSFDFNGEYVTWTTDGVNAGTVFYRNGKFNCTNVCGILSSKITELDLKFLAYILSTETYKYVSHTLANPKLMNGIMGSIELELPVIKVQQKIAEILSTADREIETLQRKLECLKLERGALMQRLLG